MESKKYYTVYKAIIDDIFIVSDQEKITAIYIGEGDFLKQELRDRLILKDEESILLEARNQLELYFSGERIQFDLPLDEQGTSFQLTVWQQLKEIPYGSTRSYQEIAKAIGRHKAVRAIGQANKANRFPIIIPCHRVIGKNNRLTGYAGSRTDIKEKLLSLEGASFKK